MDFSSDRLDCQVFYIKQNSLKIERIDTTEYLIHQSAIIAELKNKQVL